MGNRSSGVLNVVSMMAPSAGPTQEAITRYITRSGIPARFIQGYTWRERQAMLLAGEAHVGFICGLPYVAEADRPHPRLALLAAPVMSAPRYRGRPVYFSDVIVRRKSAFRSLHDLRGASWAYNEPESQSGYNLTRYHLATLGETGGFFGSVVEAGSHQAAIRMVASGAVDGASIDSTVLEAELRRHPELADALRVIDTFGPSSSPPVVASRLLPAPVQNLVRELLLEMHEDREGRAILQAGGLARFVAREDRNYDDIRRMACRASGISLTREEVSLISLA